MIIEMRTYQLRPGTAAGFEERFKEGLTARLQFSPLGALWQTDIGPLNQVIHVWPYESLEDRERIGGLARKTGKWPPKTHEFILTQESKILTPAPFSPPIGMEKKLGNIYEIRTYTYLPGAMPTVLERWGKAIDERVKLSPLAGCWYSIVGSLNQFIHVWPYENGAERQRIRAEALKSPNWPPPTRELLVKQENILAIPMSCSPLH
jgi:hypothetical protein